MNSCYFISNPEAWLAFFPWAHVVVFFFRMLRQSRLDCNMNERLDPSVVRCKHWTLNISCQWDFIDKGVLSLSIATVGWDVLHGRVYAKIIFWITPFKNHKIRFSLSNLKEKLVLQKDCKLLQQVYSREERLFGLTLLVTSERWQFPTLRQNKVVNDSSGEKIW